eukprot:CAMPEP_0168810834 /NCGR_PEP_ID=MMETSP0726-20121227/3810_1 /TAXON_ID=265536 /ORGANISM="Amphiprora sp., Strain CCMP467" /LENGTH=92 /DNA_ID=CAMNT_0008862871 /DNA_START=246 /DNA_END=521 /DNA_ORIENTATION=-
MVVQMMKSVFTNSHKEPSPELKQRVGFGQHPSDKYIVQNACESRLGASPHGVSLNENVDQDLQCAVHQRMVHHVPRFNGTGLHRMMVMVNLT